MHLDRRLVLPGVVDDLAGEGIELGDGEDRAALQLALLADIAGPLFLVTGKADVVFVGSAVVRLTIGGKRELLLAVLEQIIVSHWTWIP
jgi:hypothetical protein